MGSGFGLQGTWSVTCGSRGPCPEGAGLSNTHTSQSWAKGPSVAFWLCAGKGFQPPKEEAGAVRGRAGQIQARHRPCHGVLLAALHAPWEGSPCGKGSWSHISVTQPGLGAGQSHPFQMVLEQLLRLLVASLPRKTWLWTLQDDQQPLPLGCTQGHNGRSCSASLAPTPAPPTLCRRESQDPSGSVGPSFLSSLSLRSPSPSQAGPSLQTCLSISGLDQRVLRHSRSPSLSSS